jgi:hypothetical protein
MADENSSVEIPEQLRVWWKVIFHLLEQDLERAGLDRRAYARARIQLAVHDDDSDLVQVQACLRALRKGHLN